MYLRKKYTNGAFASASPACCALWHRLAERRRFQLRGSAASTVGSWSRSAASTCTSRFLGPSCPQSLFCPHFPSTSARQAASSTLLDELKGAFFSFLSSEQILLEYLRKHNNTLVVSWGNGPTFTGKRHGADLAGLPSMPNARYCTECPIFIKCHSQTKLCWHNERRRSFQYICVLPSCCLQRWPFVLNDKLTF